MRVKPASGEVSVAEGKLSWQLAGRCRPKILLRRSSCREGSKSLEENDDDLTGGYSCNHCPILRILFFRRLSSLLRFVLRIESRSFGEQTLLKISVSTDGPTVIRRRQSLAKLSFSLLEEHNGVAESMRTCLLQINTYHY